MSFFDQVKQSFIQQGYGEYYWLAVLVSGAFLIWMLLGWIDARSHSYARSRGG